VAEQLTNLRFGCHVKAIYYDKRNERFAIYYKSKEAIYARKIVLGIGSKPNWSLEIEKKLQNISFMPVPF
jgi:lysine/ornithine N-monooxygenase